MNNNRINRAGYTLVELIVSVGASSVLLMGLGSSLFLAGQTMAPSDVLKNTLEGTEILHNLTDDIQNAIYISSRTETAVEFVITDMDGDNQPDVVRYEWSGVPGEPLTKKFNHGTPINVIDSVQDFSLKYKSRTTNEYFPPSLEESSEHILVSRISTSRLKTLEISSSIWPGLYFSPTLPAEAESWKITRFNVSAQQHGDVDGQFKLQMRPATAGNLPSSSVIEEMTINESSLTASRDFNEFTFSNVSGILPTQDLCAVFEHVTGTFAGGVTSKIRGGKDYSVTVSSRDSGATWEYDTEDPESLIYEMWGTYSSGDGGNGMEIFRTYLTGVHASLQLGSTSASQVRTGIPLLNSPELLSNSWKLDFDVDPTTTDVNYDNLNDWSVVGGGEFNNETLTSGVWQADSSVLRTSPDNDFTQTITTVLKMRSVTTGGLGAVFELYSDWATSTAFPLRLRVTKLENGTQTFTAEAMNSGGTWDQVVEVNDLPLDLIEIRSVISPVDKTHALFLQGSLLNNYNYSSVSADTSKKYAALYESGCDAEFDFVSIRVSE